jgi:hypothetical protein
MAALCTTDHSEGPGQRNLLLRMMDAFAEQQLSYAHRAISRNHRLRADSTSVAQPSSMSARSSTSACDR